VSELAKVIMENGGDIAESRMMRMGGDFTIMMR
jgi:glycine cleavage system regulatory protein